MSAAPLLRVYRGETRSDTVTQFSRDAVELTKQGYDQTSMSWEDTTLTVTYQPRAAMPAPLVVEDAKPKGLSGWAQRRVADDHRRALEKSLRGATKDFTIPTVMREYKNDPKDQTRFAEEAALLGEHGYHVADETQGGGNIHAGRLLLTGGLSVFAGRRGIRSGGKLMVMFKKGPQPSATPPPSAGLDIADQLRKLGELRDAGVLTQQEFDSKKAELLARM